MADRPTTNAELAAAIRALAVEADQAGAYELRRDPTAEHGIDRLAEPHRSLLRAILTAAPAEEAPTDG